MNNFLKFILLIIIAYTDIITPCCIIDSPIAIITDGITQPHGVNFSPDGQCIVVSDSTSVRLYVTTDGTCAGFNGATATATITNGSIYLYSATFSPDGQCLAISDRGNSGIPTDKGSVLFLYFNRLS